MERIVQSTKPITETKAERKARKLAYKQNKASEETGLIVDNVFQQNNYVVCLKWGNKYSSEYVNRLNNMVARNLTIPYEFVCFTDNKQGIDAGIRVEPLPTLPTQGWWYKPYFLSADLPIKGTLLFLDLDVVVFKNIDELFSYQPERFCIIRDFNRSLRANWDRMNSSVFRTPIGMHDSLWQDFKRNPAIHTSRNRGDQDWMFRHIKNHVFWPDEWIQSYKWEMRGKNKLAMVNGKRNFADIAEPTVLKNTSIAVFHGDPNPADCKDPWVVDRWR